MNFPKETLEGMYHTKEPFLESYNVPVIGRKFNYIPALTMDPPRVLTDPMNAYLRERRSEQGVYSDFPKTTAAGAIDALWEDGDYNDVRRGMNADYEFNQETLKAQFKPSDVYEFMRADAERYTEETIKDFFASQYEDKEEQKRAFLMDYGMSPAEAEQIMRQQKTEVATAALKEYIANKRPIRPQGLRVDAIARNFMRNDVPMVEANGFFDPDGNLQPGVTGLGLSAAGAGRTVRGGPRMAARSAVEVGDVRSFFGSAVARRDTAEEAVRNMALGGLPVMPVSEVEREAKLAKKAALKAKGEAVAAMIQARPARAIKQLLEETARFAEYRERAKGPEKAQILKEFMEAREDVQTKGSGERILKSVALARGMREGAGRPMEPLSTSLALVQQRERKTRERMSGGAAARGAGEK